MTKGFKDTNYYEVQGWMINRLKLKGNELIIFAIINGFTQDKKNWYEGSLAYLMSAIGCSSKNTVVNSLKNLIEKKYILKRNKVINNINYCEYKINDLLCQELVGGIPKNDIPYQKMIQGIPKNDTGGISNFDINNNILNNNINNKKEYKEKRFIKPTLEEVKSYCSERNNSVDAERFIDYYESVGWKVGKNSMKDWKASVRTWERNSKPKEVNKDSLKQIEKGMYKIEYMK